MYLIVQLPRSLSQWSEEGSGEKGSKSILPRSYEELAGEYVGKLIGGCLEIETRIFIACSLFLRPSH